MRQRFKFTLKSVVKINRTFLYLVNMSLLYITGQDSARYAVGVPLTDYDIMIDFHQSDNILVNLIHCFLNYYHIAVHNFYVLVYVLYLIVDALARFIQVSF